MRSNPTYLLKSFLLYFFSQIEKIQVLNGTTPEIQHKNDDHSETHPCFEPIVWTNGTNKDNQPDLADLQEKCKQGQTIQHKVKLLDQIFQGNANIIGMYLYLKEYHWVESASKKRIWAQARANIQIFRMY